MKKYFSLISVCLSAILILFFAGKVNGQWHYLASKAQNVAGTYTDLGTSGIAITTANFDNANSSAQNIGFTFYFNGTAFTQFVLNTNGFIKLGSTSPAATNNFDVLSSTETNTLAPFNYDLRAGTLTTEYRVATAGIAGSRVCTIQFENVRDATASQYNNINFQVKLYETSNMIEFVYGTFAASGAAAAFKEMIVGIKGSDSTFSVNATKSSADAWSTTSFINGVYPAPNTKFNNRNNVLPTSGRIFRFSTINDAKAAGVYTLTQLPIPLANPHTIRASITNTGGTVMNNLSVTLNVAGANSFTNTQVVSIPPFTSLVVTFATFSPVNLGDDVVTVTIPADDSLSNNSVSCNQKVNYNTYSYEDESPQIGGLGWVTNAGLFLVKYKITGTDTVATVKVGLSSPGVGNTIYAVVMDALGNIVAQSDPYITNSYDPGTTKEFVINNAPAFTNTDFYVGLAQTANPSAGYYPLGLQSEDPARPGAYYTLFGLAGGVPGEAAGYGRFMISAVMKGKKDAAVVAVYTLGKNPRPFGTYHHVVSAKIRNTGTGDLTNYPVILNITGANSVTDTQYTFQTLHPQDSVLIEFNRVSLWNAGNTTVTVSVPSDYVNSNNSASYLQVVNDTLFSYADTSTAFSSAGLGTAEGTLWTYYESTGGSVQVTDVRVRISNDPANVGKTVQAIAQNAYTLDSVYSNPYIIQNADLGTFKKFKLITPLSVYADLYYAEKAPFYVGLKQYAGSVAYLPVSRQRENLMIEALVRTAPAIPEYPDIVLLGWDFIGINSPVTAAASKHHSLLTSSNHLTRGPGAPPSPGTNSFLTTGFQNDGISTTNSDYFQFVIGTGVGDTMSLSDIFFSSYGDDNFVIDPGGVNSQFAYSLDGINFTLIHSPVDTYSGLGEYIDVSDIPQLQNLVNTTVTFRYYASGNNSTGAWGFGSLFIRGSIRNYSIIPDPVAPMGADFLLADCSSTSTGSISFTSTGIFPPGNIYIAKMDNSIWIDNPAPVTIGTLASNANSGTINFTIPANSYDGLHRIWIESSAVPGATSLLSQPFFINRSIYCPNAGHLFRSKQSGNWNDTATWETRTYNTDWIPSPNIPDTAAYQVQISHNDTVTITTPITQHWLLVYGKLKLLNDGVNNGSLMLCWSHENNHTADGKPPMKVYGTFQIISSANYDSVIKVSPTYPGLPTEIIKVSGRITIGDGSAITGNGFHAFATGKLTRFYSGSIFEWNSTSSYGPAANATYFQTGSHPIFQLTKMPSGNFGNADSLVVNGFVEVNTPVTMSGAGKKIFVDGIKGSSTLTQASGSGEFKTLSEYEIIPPVSEDPGSTVGIMDGTVTINLSNAGLTLINGITVTDSANVRIIGSGISKGKIKVQTGGKMTLDPASVMTIENADLANYGTINGAGTIRFTGSDTSFLTSPGFINAKVELSNKQLRLDSNAVTSSIDLIGGSHLKLGSFNLNMRTGNLVADAANFIVTNDTGRLSRFVGNTDVPFHIGISETSYTPVTVINSGTPDKFMVRVGQGIFKDSAITHKNVDRTWFVTDSLEGGSNVKLKMQWNTTDQQPEFDPNQCYVSRISVCPLPRNCSGSYFDADVASAATNLGQGNYSRERNGIDSFKTNAFVVTSRTFVYTFTGNGDWNIADNWTPAIVPPDTIPAGVEVVINHSIAPGSECFHPGNITVATGGKLTVLPGKKFRLAPN